MESTPSKDSIIVFGILTTCISECRGVIFCLALRCLSYVSGVLTRSASWRQLRFQVQPEYWAQLSRAVASVEGGCSPKTSQPGYDVSQLSDSSSSQAELRRCSLARAGLIACVRFGLQLDDRMQAVISVITVAFWPIPTTCR